MTNLKGKVAWVTGAGSGIGEGAALTLAAAGAAVVLTGRRKEPLIAVAGRIKAAGGTALVKAGDLMKPATAQKTVAAIQAKFRRLDILVNNAGLNIQKRGWSDLDYEGVDTVIQGNLSSAYYCVIASLPMMRAQKDGVLIHTASWAGRFIGALAGTAYTAAKHAVVAMSHTLNLEECVNGIRSTVLCPAEVATPILDKRPIPVSKADRAKMLQPDDLGDLILYIATRPAHVCLNEVVISPTWNRAYVAAMPRGKS